MNTAESHLLTSREAASIFKVKPITIVELAKSGKFKACKLGHQWRIDRASLERYFESTSTQPAGK
jgi:excisionase family DNA binding protein